MFFRIGDGSYAVLHHGGVQNIFAVRGRALVGPPFHTAQLWCPHTKVVGGLRGGVRGGEKTPMLLLSLNQSSLHEFLEQQLRRHGDGVDGDAGRVEDGVAKRWGRTDERRLAERLVAVYA